MRLISLTKGLLLTVAALPLAGCNDYVFKKKFPESVKEATKLVPAAKPTPADILFIVDNSGSMADEQENLARNFDAFIEAIAGQGDYQIAVVTTDVVSNGGENGVERQGLQSFTFRNTFPFVLTNFDGSQCSNTQIPHGCFRGPVITSAQSRDDQINGFKQAIRVGSCGSGNEMALKAMVKALRAPCNGQFLRPDANLVVVIVSDEEDWEISPANTAGPVGIMNYVNELIRLKGSAAAVRVAAIVGSMAGNPARCRTGGDGKPTSCGGLCQQRAMIRDGSGQSCMPGAVNTCPAGEFCGPGNRCENQDLQYWDNCYWCSFYNTPDCCAAVEGSRYIEFAKAMEGAIVAAQPNIARTMCTPPPGQRAACLIDSICQSEFRETLIRIAKDLVISTEYNLDPPAVYPPGVVVRVAGRNLTYCPNPNPPATCQYQEPPMPASCDYDIVTDGECRGTKLLIRNPPAEGEAIEIFFVTERTTEGM